MSVQLTKGQSISLDKVAPTLTRVGVGLGWDEVPQKGGLFSRSRDIDLDASVIVKEGGQVSEVIFYGNLNNRAGTIQHQGDNLTGAGDGDDEVVNIDLSRMNTSAELFVVITSYSKHTFKDVRNVFARIWNDSTSEELVRYNLGEEAEFASATAMVMARLVYNGTAWTVEAVGQPQQANTPQKLRV